MAFAQLRSPSAAAKDGASSGAGDDKGRSSRSDPEVKAEDLPDLVRGDMVEIFEGDKRLDLPLDDVLASVERRAILSALRRAGGQRSRAARAMGVSRSRLYRRMEALGIHPREDL